MSLTSTALNFQSTFPLQTTFVYETNKSSEVPLHQYIPSQQAPKISCCILWQRLKKCCRRKHPLEDSLSVIVTSVDLSVGWEATQQKIIRALSVPKGSRAHWLLQNIFNRLSQEQINSILSVIAQVSIEKDHPHLIQDCLQFITLDQMLGFSQEGLNLLENKMTHIAKYASTNDAIPVISKKKYCYLIRVLRGLMETILRAFSYFEAGREPGSTWEASQILSIYGKVFAFPLLLLGVLGTLIVNPVTALLVTTGIVVTLGASLLIYVKYLRGRPEHIEASHNLSIEAAQGNLPPTWGRYGVIMRVIKDLAPDSTKTRRHPLLVGEPGVGKNTIVGGLATRILQGKVPSYLEKNTIQEVNTSSLHDSSFSQDNLSKMAKLLNQVEEYETECVLFFDEIHTAVRENSDLADRLQKELDHLPKVIAATTIEGYKILKKNRSLLRRFHIVPVDSSEEQETILILREIVRREARDIDVSEKMLRQIFKQTKLHLHDKAQPDISKQILLDAISDVRSQLSEVPSMQEFYLLNEQYESVSSRYKRFFHKSIGEEIAQQLKELEEKRNAVRDKCTQEQNQRTDLKKYRQLIDIQKKNLIEIAMKVRSEAKSEKRVDLKKAFLFISKGILPCIEEQIGSLQQNLPATAVTKDLIKKLVQQEAETHAKL